MLRNKTLVITLFVLSVPILWASDTATIKLPEPKIVEEAVDDTATEEAPVELPEYKGPAPEPVGEPIKWISANADKWKGWSLTGYSWGGLTEDYRPWRFKVGIVNGEWGANRKAFVDEGWADFADWESQMRREPVFGISFTIRF